MGVGSGTTGGVGSGITGGVGSGISGGVGSGVGGGSGSGMAGGVGSGTRAGPGTGSGSGRRSLSELVVSWVMPRLYPTGRTSRHGPVGADEVVHLLDCDRSVADGRGDAAGGAVPHVARREYAGHARLE